MLSVPRGPSSHNQSTAGWMDACCTKLLLRVEDWEWWLGLSSLGNAKPGAQQDTTNAISLINLLYLLFINTLKKAALKFWLKLEWCSSEVSSNLLFFICLITRTSRKRDEETEGSKVGEDDRSRMWRDVKTFQMKGASEELVSALPPRLKGSRCLLSGSRETAWGFGSDS